ncbi:MAG: hypothetical protein JKY61_00800 [Planctomycetes bacterium]|nr:hypothetical protein [Planctomycetota bacterium]
MWREAGLEQEFKRMKADLQPEITELASARKALNDGKSLLNGPVAHWRKNIGLELEDVVEASGGTATVEAKAPEAEQGATNCETDTDAEQGPVASEAPKPRVGDLDPEPDADQ